MKKLLLSLLFVLSGCPIQPDPPNLLREYKIKNEPLYGYDVLGLAMYCDRFLAAPKLETASTLLNTFGDPLPCIEKRIQRSNLSNVQVDLIDATCWRNHNCAPGSPKPDDLKTIEARARQVNNTAKKFPATQFWVSFGLEHDIKDCKKVQQAIDASLKGCPLCKAIQSPFSGCVVPNVPVERHGNNVKSFSVSNDGQSIFDSNSPVYRTNGTNFVFAWFNELNLRFSGEKTFTPPKLRKCKPPMDLFVQASLLLQEQTSPAPFPAACKTGRDVLGTEILKTNSENYCSGGARDNKPLFISKIKGNTFPILAPSGKQIGCFKYYGSYSGIPGSSRYYEGSCSGKTPVQLFHDAGGEWAFIKNGNQCIRFNTIRRLGSFR